MREGSPPPSHAVGSPHNINTEGTQGPKSSPILGSHLEKDRAECSQGIHARPDPSLFFLDLFV